MTEAVTIPPVILLKVPAAACGLLGVFVIVGRLRSGRRTPAQWLALTGFSSWTAAVVLDAAWPFVSPAGLDDDYRHLAVGLLSVACVLAVSLVITTFGVLERLRPLFVAAAVAACWIVWWLPGHGAIVEGGSEASPATWLGMLLYLSYFMVSVGCLLVGGHSHFRGHLPLAMQVQLRLLETAAGAALAYVGVKALIFVGVQVGWPGFNPEIGTWVLDFLLAGFAVIFWLALAPPDGWLRMARRIELAEAHAFATTFALQTKDDVAEGRDLGDRIRVIALAEQVARVQDFGFDDLARLRLAAALLHSHLDLRSIGEPEEPAMHGTHRADATASRRGVHPLLARTVWVPRDVLQLLREVASARPRDPAARVLHVVDQFVTLAGPGALDEDPNCQARQALTAVCRRFTGWAEVDALRRVLWPNEAR